MLHNSTSILLVLLYNSPYFCYKEKISIHKRDDDTQGINQDYIFILFFNTVLVLVLVVIF